MDIKQLLIAIVLLLSSATCSVGGAERVGSGTGTLLAQLGDNYTGPDTGGMELTDQGRRGLLQRRVNYEFQKNLV